MYKLLKLNLARNSLRYVIKTYKIKEIYLPYYLCNAVFQTVIKENCKIKFYHIDDSFFPQSDFSDNDFILYPNYFGVCDKNVKILSDKYKNIIIDNAHSFYSAPSGLATFNSVRKFVNVAYGSYLWIKETNEKLFINDEKSTYFGTDKIKLENDFENWDIKFLDKITEFQIRNFNDKEIRKDIFLELHEKYKSENLLKINPAECNSPFCYPLLAKNDEIADKIAEKLTKSGYDIFRYWKNLPKDYNEYKFFRCLVPIPLILLPLK